MCVLYTCFARKLCNQAREEISEFCEQDVVRLYIDVLANIRRVGESNIRTHTKLGPINVILGCRHNRGRSTHAYCIWTVYVIRMDCVALTRIGQEYVGGRTGCHSVYSWLVFKMYIARSFSFSSISLELWYLMHAIIIYIYTTRHLMKANDILKLFVKNRDVMSILK